MSELLEEFYPRYPLYMTEVMTLDASGQINNLEDLEDQDLSRSIGKLYIVGKNDSVSEGTAFLVHPDSLQGYRFPQNSLICLTDFHNLGEIFSSPLNFYVSFENPCKSKKFVRSLKHLPENCPRNIFSCDVAFRFDHNSGNKNIDPITNFAYSIENDLDFLILKDTCPCGQACTVATPLIPLKIDDIDPAKELLLVGYPASEVPNKIALPYSRINPGTSFFTYGNQLKQCKGRIIDLNNDLIAITNSSIGGMSGSPIVQKKGSETIVVSMLLGGPAIELHSELISIAICISQKDFTQARNILSSVKQDPFLEPLKYLLINQDKRCSLSICSLIYNRLIKKYAKTLPNPESVLSHNLGFRIKKFFS